jgi:acetyltransferase-like isoleucine patch superfamily enzyme
LSERETIVSRLKAVRFETLDSGARVAEGARVAPGSFVAESVVLYPGVSVESGSVILDGAILGRPPISNGTTTRPVESSFASLRVGAGSIVGCHAVVYTDVDLGPRVLIGDLASIREGCRVAEGSVIGRAVMMLAGCTVGAYSRVQDQAHLVGGMTIEENVFIGMGVITSNDNEIYLSRFGVQGKPQTGPLVRRLAVIGSAATVLPNVTIGEGAQVGAGAVVTRNVAPWTVVTGVPARVRGPVPEAWREEVLRRAARRLLPEEPHP